MLIGAKVFLSMTFLTHHNFTSFWAFVPANNYDGVIIQHHSRMSVPLLAEKGNLKERLLD